MRVTDDRDLLERGRHGATEIVTPRQFWDRCRQRRRARARRGDGGKQGMDYVYVYWPDGVKTPTNYPWIYERRLRHHGGGIHVAPIAGPAFWDEGAQWLQKFAREHPDRKIRMPEDLEKRAVTG